jgi:hypothetical protein
MKKPFFNIGLLGLFLLPFVIYFNALSPAKEKIPTGYNSSIVAFEFVSDYDELDEVLGPLSEHEIQNLDKLNLWDFGFMVIYGGFLFFFIQKFGRVNKLKLLDKLKWVALLPILADAIENLQLLGLSEQFVAGHQLGTEAFTLLQFATWTKWLTLAVLFAFLGIAFTRIDKSKAMGYILFIPIILGVFALIIQNRVLIDTFSLSIFLGFLILVIYSFIHKTRQIEME